jgi:WD40 repeat protein
LAAGSSNNVVHLWDIGVKTEKCRFVGHTGSIATMVYDSKNGTLLSGSFDTTVRVWPVGAQERHELTQR